MKSPEQRLLSLTVETTKKATVITAKTTSAVTATAQSTVLNRRNKPTKGPPTQPDLIRVRGSNCLASATDEAIILF